MNPFRKIELVTRDVRSVYQHVRRTPIQSVETIPKLVKSTPPCSIHIVQPYGPIPGMYNTLPDLICFIFDLI